MTDTTFEAIGDNGINAIDGESFSQYPPQIGQNGSKARDATPAGRGFKGGNITIKLASIPNQREPGHIYVEGEITFENRSSKKIGSELFLGSTGLINFISRGGNGGNGAKGGDGQDGGDGYPGNDATEYSEATDGGPGGNGGDGGRGSDGGDGGNGGDVKVFASEQDAHLLMLIGKCDLTGGHGGLPGSHGKAGKGGRGGTGGKGNELSLQGNDGEDGKDGRTLELNLYRGHEGRNGNLEFGIVNFNNYFEHRIDHTFRLEISEFSYEIQGDARIIEPGSSIQITNMKFRNIGRSPTPKYTPIRIELDNFNNEWINSITHLYAPYDILPGDAKYLDNGQRITIEINELNTINDGNPLYQQISLRGFRAIMTQIERPIEIFNVNDQLNFIIQQPINISEVMAIRSPEDFYYEVFWFVTNISKSPFGRNSNCRRMIKTKLTKGESYGNEIDNQEILLLDGGNSVQVTSRVKLESYESHQFTVTLEIGNNNYNNHQPTTLKPIQTRSFIINPIPTENKHLLLDVTKNECININHISNFQENIGTIYLQLSNANVNTTNIGKIHVNGNIKFTNGFNILLDHYYNFDSDNYIYITQKDPQKVCDVTIVTTEQDSYLFALLGNTYDDSTNIINWKFQIINQTYNRLDSYSTIFKPRVDYFIPIIENDMQIYEPNSKGVIKGLRIRNDGEMPTPDNHNIIIKLLPTENIIPNDDILFIISKSIPFNSTYELENSTFKFSIKNNETGFENKLPLQIYDCFKFKATVTSIEHILPDFNNFENQRIMIQYPIQIGEYLSFRHPSKDEEKFSLFWKVKNISNIEFGNNSEVGRLIETSIIDDNTNDIIYTTEIDSLTKQNHSLLNTNVIINEKTLFHSYLRLGSTNFPKKLLPIQSYSFHLSPLSSNDDHKKLDLVFDLNVGRLILDNIQLNDFIQPGSFQLLLSTPETDQVGDVTIKGTLQYTNGWIIQINDTFSLDLTGWIYLYPGGKNYPSIGRINIEVSKDDTHLLYLIEKSILQSCEDQLYKVINNMETPAITNEYDRIYEFTLMDFDCIPEDNSGIYEPGSRIIIRNIKVKNTGGMPTPISHDVEVTVDLSKSTLISLPNNHKLKLPKPIEHSKQVELSSIKDDDDDHCLEFQINQQYSASKEKPLNLSDTINLKAIMFGINREIINFKFPKQLTIQYPIQICPDTKIRDFPYKDLTRISWKINNVSNIDFGSESNSKRIIKVLVKINDMTPNNSLKFKTGQTLTTFEEEITILNAKKSKEMYCELIRTLSREDPTIIEVNFSVILYLGSIENPDKGLDIEIRNNCIEVSPSYITNKNADFLLVVSPKTKKKNVDNWKNLCQQLELTMSLWDIKREGHFDLIESGVIEDISGKSIIILNDELDDDIEEKEIKQTLDYLDPFHFYQAVNNFNIKFFIAGAIIDDKRVENLFIPKEMMETSNDQPTSSIVSKIKSFVQQKGIIKHAAVMERDAVKQPIKSAKIENVQTRLRPSSFNLFASEDSYKEKKMKKLSKSLQKNHPGQRYVLVSMMGSDRSSDQVVLCKTASKTKLHLLYYNNSENITDYNESNKVGLLSCVTFTKKLENLQKLFVTSKDDSEILEIYKSLIEVDLTVELIGLSGIKETNKEITTDILLSHMELFNKFYEFIKDSKETDITAKSVDWMIGVFAKLKILLQYSGDSLIHINSASRIKQLKSILDGEYMRAFGRFTNQTNQSLQNILDGRIKFIKNSFKNEHKPAKPEKYAYFKYRMIGILRKNNLKSDFELFGDKTDFILSQSEYDNIHSTHEKTTGTIRRKKTIRQDQIKSLYIQNMFEDPSKPNNEPIGNN